MSYLSWWNSVRLFTTTCPLSGLIFKNDITASLIDLRDSMYRCMEVYYAEDLPKMVNYSMDYHKKVISFLNLLRTVNKNYYQT
jgi:hypothetical protein